jgi:hypothetical protein
MEPKIGRCGLKLSGTAQRTFGAASKSARKLRSLYNIWNFLPAEKPLAFRHLSSPELVIASISKSTCVSKLVGLTIPIFISLSAEDIDLGRSYWILHPISCLTPEAVTTVFKCSWRWRQIASETCRVLLQLLINILPSCITLVLYIYYLFQN